MPALLERHQVVLYLVALVVGGALGLTVPAVGAPAEAAITPVLTALLYVTFLAVPLVEAARSLADLKFLATLAGVNFLLAPAVAWLVTRPVEADGVLLVGLLLVLLAPCVDYVIVFTRLAGGAATRLLAAAPLLLLGQMIALPLYLHLFAGAGDIVAPGPFVDALVWLILLPLGAAVLTQLLRAHRIMAAADALMVPLMMLTLATVVASQIGGVGAQWGRVAAVVPVAAVFAVVMAAVGAVVSRAAGIDVPGRRAVTFSGATRNSLVVLPLALTLPAGYELAPLVVVTQTLTELLLMVAFVRVIPRLVGAKNSRPDMGRERERAA
ncbi:arsenic resistance protein [Corynebacterium doosanense]|uniref:Arsenic resistance protein n=1 Tax=Corynebacterium doosanense CAU 212 = DSM 45436 TaxID=558173 RepID=A0A097IEV0_9CORY|nr:arsenic resistance protein [Corynebacterium doosanense]AIT60644.1 arsenic resistance protein [Corynebacterium doosanense CAU 212 = DSM 45436]